MKLARVFPVFSACFAVLYLVAMYNNIALMTYVPRLGQWLPFTVTLAARSGPAMYWYGWLATSALGAGMCSAAALLVPVNLLSAVARPAAWLVPLGVMVGLVWILRGWFWH